MFRHAAIGMALKMGFFGPQGGGIVEAQSHLYASSLIFDACTCTLVCIRVHTCAHMHARFGVHTLAPSLAKFAVLCWCWGTPAGISACKHIVSLVVFPGEINWWAGAQDKTDPGQKAKDCLRR